MVHCPTTQGPPCPSHAITTRHTHTTHVPKTMTTHTNPTSKKKTYPEQEPRKKNAHPKKKTPGGKSLIGATRKKKKYAIKLLTPHLIHCPTTQDLPVRLKKWMYSPAETFTPLRPFFKKIHSSWWAGKFYIPTMQCWQNIDTDQSIYIFIFHVIIFFYSD